MVIAAINDVGRATIVSELHAYVDQMLATGVQGSMQFMAAHYKSPSYLFMETVPAQLQRRGFRVPAEDEEPHWGSEHDELPGFLYRDYSLPLWYAMRRYVRSVLEPRYGGTQATSAVRDAAMQADVQIKAWLAELSDERAAGVRLAPIRSFAQLVDLLTQIIFQGSAQHAAVNFGQYDLQSFQPARPLFLTRDMPRDHRQLTAQYIVNALMPQAPLSELLTLFDILTACCVNSLMLPQPSDHHSDGLLMRDTTIQPTFPAEYEQFKDELAHIEQRQIEHNARNGFHYTYLLPSRIPQSIAI